MPGLTLTLTSHLTTYNLLKLIQAVSGFANTEPSCRELHLTGDQGNGGNFVYKGGSDVSSSNYGRRLAAESGTATNAMVVYRSVVNDISLADIYLLGSADSVKVNVDWMYC